MTHDDRPTLPDHPRVRPPSDPDEESLREFGRQLALDALLVQIYGESAAGRLSAERPATAEQSATELTATELTAAEPSPAQALPEPSTRHRPTWVAGLAVAASLAIAAGIAAHFVLDRPKGTVPGPADAVPISESTTVSTPVPTKVPTTVSTPVPTKVSTTAPTPTVAAAPVELPGWRIVPTGSPTFVVDSATTTVRLDRGELRVAASPTRPRPALSVVTPTGTVSARGAEFLVGAHPHSPKESHMSKSLTRVLILVGLVTLSNPLGTVTGGPGDLLAAEPDTQPVRLAVKANTDFSVNLYKQLSLEQPGKNLFFSPYSLSSALAMTMEGARGRTADEMGEVLGLPEAARRVGPDAQMLPWNTSLLHTGIGQLQDRFNGADRTVPPETREKIARLRAEFAAATARLEELSKSQKYREIGRARQRTLLLANELNALLATVDQYELRVANRLWADRSFKVETAFRDVVNAHYKTGAIESLDILGDPESARRAINAWGAEETKNRIPEVLPAGSVNSDSRMLLANAIYFLGKWAEPFDAKLTKSKPFTRADGTKVTVPLMNQTVQAGFAAFRGDGTAAKVDRDGRTDAGKDGFALAELAYKGGDISMVLVVPNSADGLGKLSDRLSRDHLDGWLKALQRREVNVFLPKFELTSSFQLRNTLSAMGMNQAFSDQADFTGLTSERVKIADVFHKAFVKVDEEGTEAAAVTVIEAVAVSRPPEPPTVRADRPFLFLIRDVKTGTILFMGRLADPSRP